MEKIVRDQIEVFDGNRKVIIPLAKPMGGKSRRVATPEIMIKIDNILKSSYKDFTDYCELLGHQESVSRETKEHATGGLFSSGMVEQSDVYVAIPTELSMPIILGKLYKGRNIETIKIVRLSNVGEERKMLQEMEFSDCRVDWLEQRLDMVVFKFRPKTRQDTVYQYDQTGKKTGQTHEIFRFDTGTCEGD